MKHHSDNVLLTDIQDDVNLELIASGPFERLDCHDGRALAELVTRHRIDTIYHLAALLSAVAETVLQKAWDINVNGTLAVLEAARQNGCAVFTPSSIGAFGPNTPKDWTPQDTIQRPTSIYGVTKVAGEFLCDYYYHKYGIDTWQDASSPTRRMSCSWAGSRSSQNIGHRVRPWKSSS